MVTFEHDQDIYAYFLLNISIITYNLQERDIKFKEQG